MKARFTIDGSDALEKHLWRMCERVATGVREIIPNGELQALLLGGGYGRGQGGVLKTSSGEKAYNDLEFYVCVRGSEVLNREKFRGAFHELSEKLSPEAGVEVEFKISSVPKLQKFPPTMFSYDLAWGHRTVIGDDANFLERDTLHAENIPLYEATRLLMNRCSGLLFAREHLQRKPFTADDADFVGRNHAKAQLSFGDAFLTAHGQYHWDCRVRNERLVKFSPEHNLPWLDDVRRHHSLGMDFKFHPRLTTASMENLCDRQRELTHLALRVWLWLESKRLNQMFTSPREYVESNKNKCPETNPLRNFAINAKTFGKVFISAGRPFRYPRERLFDSLALLLWEPTALTRDVFLRRIQTDLRTEATAFADLVRAYESLWKNFN
jgi:hypothetical protein